MFSDRWKKSVTARKFIICTLFENRKQTVTKTAVTFINYSLVSYCSVLSENIQDA